MLQICRKDKDKVYETIRTGKDALFFSRFFPNFRFAYIRMSTVTLNAYIL